MYQDDCCDYSVNRTVIRENAISTGSIGSAMHLSKSVAPSPTRSDENNVNSTSATKPNLFLEHELCEISREPPSRPLTEEPPSRPLTEWSLTPRSSHTYLNDG